MVVPTLLRIDRVTLAETIEFSGHRTSTNNLGSAFIGALKQLMDEKGGHLGPDLGFVTPRDNATTHNKHMVAEMMDSIKVAMTYLEPVILW